jgi:hypothetical protein
VPLGCPGAVGRCRMKGGTVDLWRDPEEAPKVQAQRRCRVEATTAGDVLDGIVCGFQEALSQGDTLLEQPAVRAGTKGGAEAAGEGTGAHNGVT